MKVNINKVYSFAYPDFKIRTGNKKDFSELLSSKTVEKNNQNVLTDSSSESARTNGSFKSQYNKTENSSEKINYLGKNIDRRI
jgi:hypothetical protein